MSDDANPFSFFKEGGSVGSVGSGTDESKSRKKGKRRKRKSKTDGSGGGGGASDDFVVSPVVGDFEVGLNPFSFFVETKAGAAKKKEKKKKAKGKDNRRASAGDDFDLPPPPPPHHPADKEPASLFGSAPAPAPANRQRAQTAATGVPPVNARPTVSTPSVVETTTAHVKRVVDAPPPPVFGGSGSGSGSYDGGSGSYSSSSYSDNSGEGSPNATPTAASTGAATTVLPPVGAQAKASGSNGGGAGGVPVESNGDSTSHARLKEDLRRVKADYEDAIYRSVSAERDLEAANKKIRALEAQVVRLKAGGVASPRANRNIFGSDDEAEDASLSMDGSLGPPLPSSSGLDSPTSFLNSSQGAQILELQDEVKRLRAREAEDNRVLNEYMDKVEGKISAANRRTADANAKAKALEAEVVGLRMMLQDAHGTGMFASEKLMKLAEVGETNIRQMVAGLEHLKHAANALMAFDRVTTIPDRPNGDDDDDSDASDGAS